MIDVAYKIILTVAMVVEAITREIERPESYISVWTLKKLVCCKFNFFKDSEQPPVACM